MAYKFLEHTADVKIKVEAGSLEKAFSESAFAMKEVILKGKRKIKEEIKKKIKVRGKDNQQLLYNFLEEFLFLLDSEGFLLSKIKKLEITENSKQFSNVENDKQAMNNKLIERVSNKNNQHKAGKNPESKSGLILKAEITGDKASNYRFTNDVKAITYNQMRIEHKKAVKNKTKDKFIIEFVLDV
jgi:SHS2 domain-containing protein